MHILINSKYLTYNNYKVKCAIGKRGIGDKKKEGDLITPKGQFKIKYILYRNDNGTIDLMLSNRDGTFQNPIEIGLPYGDTQNTDYRYRGFVISDFLDSGYEKKFSALGQKHDLTAICVRDKFEFSIPDLGFLRTRDLETGEIQIVETGNNKKREEFQKRQRNSLDKLEEKCRECKTGFISIDSIFSII